MKKLICGLLCLVFACGAFAVCGENETKNSSQSAGNKPQGTLTIVEGKESANTNCLICIKTHNTIGLSPLRRTKAAR